MILGLWEWMTGALSHNEEGRRKVHDALRMWHLSWNFKRVIINELVMVSKENFFFKKRIMYKMSQVGKECFGLFKKAKISSWR